MEEELPGACLGVSESSMFHLCDAHLLDPGFALAIHIDEGIVDSRGRVAQGARLTSDQDNARFVFIPEFVVELRPAIGSEDSVAALCLLLFISAFRHGASLGKGLAASARTAKQHYLHRRRGPPLATAP